MAGPELRALAIALALVTGACDGRRDDSAQGSITVKLPAARPQAPAPSFSFKMPGKPRPVKELVN